MASASASSSVAALQRCGHRLIKTLRGLSSASSSSSSSSSSSTSSSSSSAPSTPSFLLLPPSPRTVPIWSCRHAHSLVPIRVAPPAFATATAAPALAGCQWPFSASPRRGLLNPSLDGDPLLLLLRHLSTESPTSDQSHSASVPPPTQSPAAEPSDTEEGRSLQIELYEGLPQLTIPLPSRNEPCVFTLKPVTHTVGDLVSMLRQEDAGIDRAVVRTREGVRVASTTPVQTLLKTGEFQLLINDVPYSVRPPEGSLTVGPTGLSAEEVARMGDVRALVGQLYEALHVEEHQAAQEQRLVAQIEELQAELMPLERQRVQLAQQSERRTNQLTWLGLGMMSIQFGILARLTWWEYSWDIMEPVTYFVTYGTAMACYAYWVLTKQDYILPDVRDRQFLLSFHKKAKREAWDAEKYNAIKDSLQLVERDLRRLRDPLRLRLPASALTSASEEKKEGILASQINIGSFKNLLKNKLG